MTGKGTENLLKSLQSHRELDEILKENANEFVTQSLHEVLAELLKQKGLTRAQVIQASLLNDIYAHQIFKGTRTPSRDKLLALGFGMKLSFEEMDALLKTQGYPPLYPRNARDAIIIYGFFHQLPLLEVNTELYENGMGTLS